MSSTASPTPSPQERESALFALALEKPSTQRAAFLREACGADLALLRRLEALLEASEQPGTVLEAKDGPWSRPPDSAASQPSAHLPGTAVGQVLGRYKLLEKIGEGGCGEVYVAEQSEPVRRRVALKVIKLGMDTRAVIARFEAERQALAMMDHPNIARVFDAGASAGGRPYFVMELVRGTTITEYCDRNHLGTRQRLDLFIRVCQAIQHAHQKGVIHRDIKPSNILVTLLDGVPVPKVIDFGIAKATEGRLTDATVYTQLHQFIGTPAYMSPEQTEVQGQDIDTRSDIYSLGVLLYELLSGKTPFDARELMASGLEAMRRRIQEEEAPRLSTRLSTLGMAEQNEIAARRGERPEQLNKLLRGELDWILLKALEKDRNRRYGTASAFADDVQRYLASEPVSAVAPSAAYRLRKWIGRNRVAFAATSVVATALVAGLGVSTWALLRERASHRRAEAAAVDAGQARDAADDARRVVASERDQVARLLSVSQAERGVRLLEAGDRAGLLHLVESRRTVEHLPEERLRRTLLWSGWFDSLPRFEVQILTASNAINSLAICPGKPWIATTTTGREVILWDLDTGRRIAGFNAGDRPVDLPQFSANGRLLVLNANGLRQLWDLAPVESNLPPRLLLAGIRRLAFDPARRRLITFSNEGRPLPGNPPSASPATATPDLEQVQLWDSTAEPLLTATWDRAHSSLGNANLALNADGTQVATKADSVQLRDARTGRPLPVEFGTNGISQPGSFFDALHFSPNGRWLWEVRDGALYRRDSVTGRSAGNPLQGLHRWRQPQIDAGGRHLVVFLEQGLRVVRLDDGEVTAVGNPAGGQDFTGAAVLDPDARQVAAIDATGAIRFWDRTPAKPEPPRIVTPSGATAIEFSPDGRRVAILGRDGSVRLQPVTAPPMAGVKEWPLATAVGFDARGRLLMHFASNGSMQWWNPSKRSADSDAWKVTEAGPLIGAALSGDGNLAATVAESAPGQATIRLWNTASGTASVVAIPWTNAGPIAFSPDARTLAGVSGEDGSIHLWDVATGKAGAVLKLPQPMEVTWGSIRFSPDGRFIATRSGFRTLHLWDLATGKLLGDLARGFYVALADDWKRGLTESDLIDLADPRHPKPVSHPGNSGAKQSGRGGLALSPDGRLRIAMHDGRTLRLWDLATERSVGQEIVLRGTAPEAWFTPDSRLVVVAQQEGGAAAEASGPRASIRLWETSTGLPCGNPIPTGSILDAPQFDREMRFLAQTDLATAARVWRLPSRDPSLAEMERQSWLAAGSRLDEAGNPMVLDASALKSLEATGGSVPR